MNFFKKLFGGGRKPEKVQVFINESVSPGRSKYCNVNKILVRIHIQSHTISKADSHVSVKKADPDVFNPQQGSKMDLWVCEHTINPEPRKFKCGKKCVYSLGVQMAAKSDFEIAGDKLNKDGTVPLEFLRRAGGINFTSEPKLTDK
jgi:hypothetical protein